MPPSKPPPSFTCPRCQSVSYHPVDVERGYCVRCHAFTRVQLRVRLFIDGRFAAESWIGEGIDVDSIGQTHQRRAEAAERDGLAWMVEIWDPDAPIDQAFMRFGTDRNGMVMPHEVTRWPWETGDGV
jgi:hypothetical protein